MTKEAGLSDTQLYKQAGNAVTVDVIEQIGKRLVLEDDETMIAYVLEKHYEQD
ncbi:DNA cytosine methyltransferase [Lactobacillus johnsonii]